MCHLHNNKNIYFILRYVDFCSISLECALFCYFPGFCTPPWLIMPSAACTSSDIPSQIFLIRVRFTQWCEYLNWINGKLDAKRGVPMGGPHVSPGICIWLSSTTLLTPPDGSSVNHSKSLLRLLRHTVHTSVFCFFSTYYFVAFCALKRRFVQEHKWKNIRPVQKEGTSILSLTSDCSKYLTDPFRTSLNNNICFFKTLPYHTQFKFEVNILETFVATLGQVRIRFGFHICAKQAHSSGIIN